MIKDISVQELEELEKEKKPILVDVRSEGEFAEATIHGAVNLPLLNNLERADVGTTYTHDSPSKAREMGLKFVGPKLPELVKKAEELAEQGPLVLFCWRGGMRSKSFASVLDNMGIPVYRLQGGFKAYRRKVVDYFQKQLPVHVAVLRGNTGVGKTEILADLRRDGYPAIDLEKLANNRGSVFGAVGLGESPTQKTFEGLLYEALKTCSSFPYIIVECESKRIGRVVLPENFFKGMQSGTQILIYDKIENRVNRLVKEYTAFSDSINQIRQSLNRLIKTMGHKKIEELYELLEIGQLEEFTRRLLVEYYDPLYSYPNQPSSEYILSIDHANQQKALEKIKNYLDQNFGEK